MIQLDLINLDELEPRPRLRRGDRVTWKRTELGLIAGEIVGVWPSGYTAYRDGVKRTRPHTLAEYEPRRANA